MTAYVLTVTVVHVLISLAAIAAGFPVVWGLLTRKSLDRWNAFFLATTVATSATGFLFPVDRILPSHVLSVISLVVLAVAIYARYGTHLAGTWRPVYASAAVAAFYLNVFVLIVQSFLKVPSLHALAPTQTEMPFAAVQLLALVTFVVIGVFATLRSRQLATMLVASH
jgi:hypothetical protein